MGYLFRLAIFPVLLLCASLLRAADTPVEILDQSIAYSKSSNWTAFTALLSDKGLSELERRIRDKFKVRMRVKIALDGEKSLSEDEKRLMGLAGLPFILGTLGGGYDFGRAAPFDYSLDYAIHNTIVNSNNAVLSVRFRYPSLDYTESGSNSGKYRYRDSEIRFSRVKKAWRLDTVTLIADTGNRDMGQ